jgi:hypothetical protein
MSTLKSVGNKLFKTELASHNVELANLQSVVKLEDSAFKLKDKALASAKKISELAATVRANTSSTVKAFEAVINEVDALETQAKELGLSLPNDARLARDSAKREVAQFNELNNKVNSINI